MSTRSQGLRLARLVARPRIVSTPPSSRASSSLRPSFLLNSPRPAVFPSRTALPSTSSFFPLTRSSSTSNGDAAVDPSVPVNDDRELTEDEYHEIADEDMDKLHENLEVLCEDFGGGQWEVEYSSGVMTLSLPPLGTYVINKQPPNQQIWVSSPISGPSRWSYSTSGSWVHHRRPGITLGAVLDEELQGVLKGVGGTGWTGVGLE